MMHEGMHTAGLIWMLLMAAIMVIPFWKLSSRLGYPGALGLLVLVPLVNLAFFYFLAFANWPIETRTGTGPDNN